MWTHLFGGPDWMPITPKRGSFLHADSQFGLSIPTDAWSFEFEGKTWRIRGKRGLVDQSTGLPA